MKKISLIIIINIFFSANLFAGCMTNEIKQIDANLKNDNISVEIKSEKLQSKLDTLELISTQLAKWEKNLLPEREAARLNLQWEDMRQGRKSAKKATAKEQIVKTDLNFGWSIANIWYVVSLSLLLLLLLHTHTNANTFYLIGTEHHARWCVWMPY